VTIDKVWFNDNAVWRRENSSSVEYTSNALPVSKALADLQFVAGETAVGFPSQQDGLWVCVCGRPNPDSEEYCARCRREKSLLFARYNQEAVEKQISQREKQLELSTRSVREDTARMQRIREEEYEAKQRRKTRRWRLLITIPACMIVAAMAIGFTAPMLQLFAANKAIREKHWDNAVHSLTILGPAFPGTEQKLKDVRKAMAMEKADAAQTAEQMNTETNKATGDMTDAAKILSGMPAEMYTTVANAIRVGMGGISIIINAGAVDTIGRRVSESFGQSLSALVP
jgi:hypothetical protein